MSTLISMVGQQPAAIATTAKTLLMYGGLERVILLPTEKTKSEFNRLERYLRESLHIPAGMIEHRYISTEVVKPKDGYALAWEAIKKCLDRVDLSQPVYFDTSPGLNYQTALISYHLKDDQRFEPLYADNKKLHNLTNGASWDLDHIGFKELLELYGLREKNGKEPENHGEAVHDVVIVGGKEPESFISACEKRGHFYGLYLIWENDITENSQQTKHEILKRRETDRVRQDARKIERIIKDPRHINFLHPEYTVCTNNYTVKARLAAYGIKVIFNNNKKIEKIREGWGSRIEMRPWSAPPGVDVPIMKVSGDNTVIREIPEWSGKNLVVALGVDPSATLTAIFTHKPKELAVLWDSDSPWISVIAERIKEWAVEIPAQKITFWPWTLRMLGNVSETPVFQPKSDWIINITPGTKLHSWYLSRLDVAGIYSLDNEKSRASNLLNDDKIFDFPMDFPTILLKASVHQGTLLHEDLSFDKKGWKVNGDTTLYSRRIYAGTSANEILSKKDFLKAIISNIAKSIDKSITKSHIPYSHPLTKKTVVKINPVGKSIEKNVHSWKVGEKIEIDSKNFIECKDVNLKNKTLTFEVCLNGKTPLTGLVNAPPDGGFWLEEPVAGAFYAAGGKKIKDIRVGVKWPWLGKEDLTDKHRTEIDVVLLWKEHYICVSCKAGIKKDNFEQLLAETINEIMAEARVGFGRFAIPVLVRGGINKESAVQDAKNSLQHDGLLQIGLSLLNQPNVLNDLVEMAIEEYRTLL